MKKLLCIISLSFLIVSCSSQPTLNNETISNETLKELKKGNVDTLLVVVTNKDNFEETVFSYFKTDKNQTYVGSVKKYNDFDSILLLFFIIGLLLGSFFISIFIDN
jgi:hypothetical protein